MVDHLRGQGFGDETLLTAGYPVTICRVIRGNFKLTFKLALATLWSVAYRRMVEAGASYAQVLAIRHPVAPDRKR